MSRTLALLGILLTWASAAPANMLLAGGSSSPIVHATGSNTFTDNTTTLTFTIPATVAGHYLFVAYYYCGNSNCDSGANLASTTTSTLGAAAGARVAGTQASFNSGWEQNIINFENIAAGQTAVTITFPHGVFYSHGSAVEVSGAATSAVAEGGGNAGAVAPATNPFTCTMGSAASATNETIIGFSADADVVNSPFIDIGTGIGVAYQVGATASAYTVSYTNPGATGMRCSIFAIKHP